MTPLQLLALKHPALIHFPIAATLFLFPALLLARREDPAAPAGWSLTARYLAWAGLASLLPPLLSGYLWAKGMSLIPAGHLMAPLPAPGDDFAVLIRRHELFSLLSLALGAATVASLGTARRRPGGVAIACGALWMALTLATGFYGGKMTHPIGDGAQAAAVTAPEAASPSPRT
ncbi:MAG TPA: hypothetical protein VFT46_11365 [Holophagaceae bacterium]|nr:hypothetical protein [Holophagaceae bacterium]